MEVTCLHCGTTMHRPPSHVYGKVFCNKECRKAYHRPMKACRGCGVEYARDPKAPVKQYCSWECFKRDRWQLVECHHCGCMFQKRVSEIQKAEARGYRHTCSRSCRNSSTSLLLGGDGTWVEGGRHGAARNRGKDWPAAKAYALERDGYCCQQCDADDHLEVHHWEPYAISFNNHPDNLVTLCRSCHQDKHAEYVREGFYEDLHR